jgi:transposase
MAENGCKWRGLPKEYGKWNSVYRRVNRWAKLGVLKRLFYALEKERIAKVGVRILALDSTSCKVHPDGMGALKKTECRALGKQGEGGTSSFMWYPQMIKS